MDSAKIKAKIQQADLNKHFHSEGLVIASVCKISQKQSEWKPEFKEKTY